MDINHIRELIPLAGLTERERMVFEATIEGFNYKEIAKKFKISVARSYVLVKHAALKIHHADKRDNIQTDLRMYKSKLKDIIRELISEITNESFGGYVHDKDMKKDPKHITGERWRIKFQSTKDLEKHGNTEKSPVDEDKINITEIKTVVRDLLSEMWTGWEENRLPGLSDDLNDPDNQEEKEDSKNYKSASDVVTAVAKGILDKQEAFNILMSKFLIPAEVAKVNVNLATISFLMKTTQNRGLNEGNEYSYDKPKSRKRYIIIGRSGPVMSYYCESPTQGARMVQNAFSMAKEFETEEEMRNKIRELQVKYKGMKFDFDIVPAGKYPGVKPKKYVVSKPVKVEGEWIVKWYKWGIRDENKTYYTDDKQDAFLTYGEMIKQADMENKKDNE